MSCRPGAGTISLRGCTLYSVKMWPINFVGPQFNVLLRGRTERQLRHGRRLMGEDTTDELKIAIEGAMALVTLDRPKALNSLTSAMRARLVEGLIAFSRDPNVYCAVIHSTHPKAFSAGSDVREVIDLARSDMARARQTFRDEYSLNWHCECFSKPTVSLIGGMVMGGGAGISLFGTHRVAGEGYRFAMPETKIGLFPDVGVCHVFARMPSEIGLYLGLTGAVIGRADAYALGLVTHCIPETEFANIRAELADVQPVDVVLDSRHADPGESPLLAHADTISRCFSAPTVEEMLMRLDGTQGEDRAWAQSVAADLRARSPLSLKVTHRHIRESKSRDLRETLIADYRLACRFLEGRDFYEGVRAVLIDKDNAPRWKPERFEDASAAMVSSYFESLGAGEMSLATREEMQAMRA